MPYILIRLDAPTPLQVNNIFPINLGFGSDKIESVKLLQYWANGLASTLGFKLAFRGQSQTTMMGNVTTSAFPLFWSSSPTSREQLFKPIEFSGHGFMNGSGRLDVELSSLDPATIPTFTTLFLFFEINYLVDPLYPQMKNLDWEVFQH